MPPEEPKPVTFDPLNNPQPTVPDPTQPAAAPTPMITTTHGAMVSQTIDASAPVAPPDFSTPSNLFIPPPKALDAIAKPFFTPPVSDPNSPLNSLATPSLPQSAATPGAQNLGGTVITPTVGSSLPPSTPAFGSVAPETTPAPAPVSSASGEGLPAVPTLGAAPGAATAMPQPTITMGDGGYPLSGPGALPPPKRKGMKRPIVFVAAIIAILLLGGGYVFAFYLPNTPSNVYATSLDHSARAYDKLVSYASDVQAKKYKSAKLSGDFKFISGTVAADGTFSGASDDKNATGTLNLNIAGEKVSFNARSVTASGQDTPDAYFQVNGVKTFLDSYGLKQFDSLDGQWISVDHTLLESAAASAAGDSKASSDLKAPTAAQVQDALAGVGKVNRQYLFKADASHAVLKKEKYLGKSTRDDRQVYGYEVGYDKAHLKAYIKALQSSINDSSLNTWVKAASGKSASQADLSDFLSSIDNAKSDYTFTMYVDAKTKLPSTLHFKDTGSSDYFEISQSYTSGSVYPFSLKFVSNSDPANTSTFVMTAKLDSVTNKLTYGVDAEAKTDNSPITFKLNANVSLGNDTVTVTAPAGAKSVLDVYQSLGLGDLLGASAGSSSLDSAALQDFTLTQ